MVEMAMCRVRRDVPRPTQCPHVDGCRIPMGFRFSISPQTTARRIVGHCSEKSQTKDTRPGNLIYWLQPCSSFPALPAIFDNLVWHAKCLHLIRGLLRSRIGCQNLFFSEDKYESGLVNCRNDSGSICRSSPTCNQRSGRTDVGGE